MRSFGRVPCSTLLSEATPFGKPLLHTSLSHRTSHTTLKEHFKPPAMYVVKRDGQKEPVREFRLKTRKLDDVLLPPAGTC